MPEEVTLKGILALNTSSVDFVDSFPSRGSLYLNASRPLSRPRSVYFAFIHPSSAGFFWNASSLAMSSSEMYPSSAATLASTEKLVRE